MTIIDKNGERPVCDRCHRVRVKIRRGSVCVDCLAAAWKAEVRYRREMNRMCGDAFYKITRVRRKRRA